MAVESDLWKQTVSQNQAGKKAQNDLSESSLFVILVSIYSSDAKIRTDGSWGYVTLHVTGETKEEHQ